MHGVVGLRATIAGASAKLAFPRGRVQLEVGVRLRLGGGQTSVGQQTYRLRAG